MEAQPDPPLSEHRIDLIEGSVSWLVPAVWKAREEGKENAVFQCRASRAVQNAAAARLGVPFLRCNVGDTDDRLIRVSDPIAPLDMDLWVRTRPDLRNTARIRATRSFLYDPLAAVADLGAGNESPRAGGTSSRAKTGERLGLPCHRPQQSVPDCAILPGWSDRCPGNQGGGCADVTGRTS